MPKGKGKSKKPIDPNILTEVDKTFFELSIAQLTKRLERLQGENNELQEKTAELENKLSTVDQERTEVINYNKRVLGDKSEEVKVLNETLENAENEREVEIKSNNETIKQQNEKYEKVREELTTQIKYKLGRLTALEEFKSQRDGLIAKMNEKNEAIEVNEAKHKRNMYEITRKFSLERDKLKTDMENELIHISNVFQNETLAKVAITTNRVVRENIAVNSELTSVLITINRLHQENEDMRDENILFKSRTTLYKKQKIEGIEKISVQLKLVERLQEERDKLIEKLEGFPEIKLKLIDIMQAIDTLTEVRDKLERYVKILEQNLHSIRCTSSDLKTKLQYVNGSYLKHLSTLNEGSLTIKSFFKENVPKNERRKLQKKLLQDLIVLLNAVGVETPTRPSLQSVESSSEVYKRGDIGSPPIVVVPRSKFQLRFHQQIQMGGSFQEFLGRSIPPKKIVPHEVEDILIEEQEEEEEEKEKERKEKTPSKFVPFEEMEELVFAKSAELTPLSSTESETIFSTSEMVPLSSGEEEETESEDEEMGSSEASAVIEDNNAIE